MPRNRRVIVEEVSEVEEDEVDTNDVADEEEMDFSITRRPATRLDELFPVDDEDNEDEGDAEVIPDVGARPNCILCRHKATVLGDKTCDVKTPTTWICGFCKVPLCLTKTRNCYKEYHGF
ncbi:hypothetical protein K457DRAFT_37177 [Linnemannia elongata AG-77]|uniref:PiggyBac transposable element-derived protein 4 C-terminal zinc-ribbon domain-containing protein n=1 Tax=Linnemannia elongata AG-77 TaxID=1314771 RepID=A0A197JD95_9FUNG|nr:hypothetical protein K457DRAFT_37177 [Linnemannia elongata AG-77]